MVSHKPVDKAKRLSILTSGKLQRNANGDIAKAVAHQSRTVSNARVQPIANFLPTRESSPKIVLQHSLRHLQRSDLIPFKC